MKKTLSQKTPTDLPSGPTGQNWVTVHVLGPSFLEHIAVLYLEKKIRALGAREK